ncbi:unnamed protein product [Angiostrongylus costaricensis]|uniref:lysozyme n=1 Tax=Angiostrongylus costaricensis TaxID=334426 RepID=A0A0R3PHC9_ANGCS|nr:unnamed protein product [Angiostrongylus costaricensis]
MYEARCLESGFKPVGCVMDRGSEPSYHDHYKGRCPATATDLCEAMARLHNGGPKECEKPSTLDYLKDMSVCC